MSLYLIRHGESRSNEQNLFAGRVDTPLTEMGRRQARQARALIEKAGLEFDEVHVSPLSRAMETATLVIENSASKPVDIFVVPELVERDFGKLSEQNKSLIKKYFGASKYEEMFHSAGGKPPGGESFEAMYERVKLYHESVLLPRSASGRRILVVAHKYIIEMFALVAAGMTPNQYHDFKIPNSKPCSLEDLGMRARSASRSLNHISEEIEARLTSLILFAAAAGVILKWLVGQSLPAFFFSAATVLLLGANSWISLLRLETRTFVQAPLSIRKFWKGALLRALAGLGLLMLQHPLAQAMGAFLLLPPAMTAPTLSLMWGGDYFLCIQSTLVMSLLSPAIVVIAYGLGGFGHASEPIHLTLFLVMLVTSVVLPGVLAQAYRIKRPIQSGAVTTNWGWLGGASLLPLALLTAYQLTPRFGELPALGQGAGKAALFSIALFVVARVFGWLAARLVDGESRLKTDVYINHIVPNLFFWFTLIPQGADFALIRIFSLLLFFVSIDLEERKFVFRFPGQAGLRTVRGASRNAAFGQASGKVVRRAMNS